MKLSPSLEKAYTKESLSARDAQRLAQFVAFGPVIFQVGRLMIKFGILEMLRESDNGLTENELVEKTKLSQYAVKCLLEASLSIGLVIIDTETDKYSITKTGWFLLTDPSTRVNVDFNHDVNYLGWFNLEESLVNGKPEGLKVFGEWPTIYEGLSSLPADVQKSWFGFDHFYSDNSFAQALDIVFKYNVKELIDVGGNTGRWALQCVGYNKDVNVTILDLPQQLAMMKEQTASHPGADRISGYPINLLDNNQKFPQERQYDAIWMSQFLDCFGEDEIVSILERAKESMNPGTKLFIMETFWDRQKFEPGALCLTLTSLYFTALANGNSKMYHSEDMERLVKKAGMKVEHIHDNLGWGHSIMVCSL